MHVFRPRRKIVKYLKIWQKVTANTKAIILLFDVGGSICGVLGEIIFEFAERFEGE